MRKRIVPYPRVNSDEALKSLGVSVDWFLSDSEHELQYEEISPLKYRITDKTWYPDVCPLSVSFRVEIKNPIKLFAGLHGNDVCAVAERDSVVGIALQWKLPKTNLQGAYHCKDVVFASGGRMRFSGHIDFPASVIRFSLVLELVIYLKEPAKTKSGIYAKRVGSILGPIDRFTLVTGGSGGYFPTVSEKLEGEPLWKVFANISSAEDFDEDFCADYFHLSLNERHVLYEDLYVTSRDGSVFVSPLMFEAFVNACCVLISRACKYISDRSWDLNADEKDEQTIYVNFKSLRKACLPGFTKKAICEMEIEELFWNVRAGLSKHIRVDIKGRVK